MSQPSGTPTQVETERALRSVALSSVLGAASTAKQAAKPVVPDYDLLRRIGGGAYGEVWLARNKATGVLRAAKIVWRRTFEDERPFQREFEGIQKFETVSREHPSQLALFHIGRNEAEGYFYYIMELADNLDRAADYAPHTLRADLGQGRLPAKRTLEIGLALSEALGHLHRNSLVHRDVKPSNVIFINSRPKLADIGLVTDSSDNCSVVGTEGYLPPEGPGTPQADIFALGRVLYEAATGQDRRQYPLLPPDLRSWSDATDVLELNEIILTACERDVGQRYQTCDEVNTEFALLAQGKSVKRARTLRQRWVWFRKAGIALSVLAAVALLVSIWPRQSRRSEFSSDGPDSTNLEANGLCSKGMYVVRGDNFAEFAAAYTNFNQAIALDPNFARPYVGLLELRVPETVSGVPYPTLDDMRTIARRLEFLAPRLAATYCARSLVDWGEWNFPQAARDGLESIRADPNYKFGHIWYGWMLLCFGRTDEARKQGAVNLDVAPSKVTTYRFLGNLHYLERDYTNAITWYSNAFQWEPHHVVSYRMIARCLQAMGDYTNALDHYKQADIIEGASEATAKNAHDLLRRALDRGGIQGYWAQQWKWAEANTNSDRYWKAVIQLNLGNTNVALDLLHESYAVREMGGFAPLMSSVLFDDYWDGLHADPRFKALLDELGLRKGIYPRKQGSRTGL